MEIYSNFVGHPPSQLTVQTESLVPATNSGASIDMTSHPFDTTYDVPGGNSYSVSDLPSPTDEGYATQGDLSRRSTTSTTQSSRGGDMKDYESRNSSMFADVDSSMTEEKRNVDASLRDIQTIAPIPVELEPTVEVIQEDQRYAADYRRSLKRFHALREMVDLEREYTGNMRALIDYCLTPLSSVSWLSTAEVAILVRNAHDLFAFQVKFMDEIDNAWFSSNNDPQSNDIFQNVAQCFIDFAEEFQVYKEYCVNHDAALELLTQLEKRTEWANYLKECSFKIQARSNKRVSFNLSEMLILPVQHICRYQLQLGSLLRSTPEGAPEFKDMNAANIIMLQVVSEIDEAKKAKDARVRKEKFMDKLHYDTRLTRRFINDLGDIVIAGGLYTVHYTGIPKIKYNGIFIFKDYMIVVRVKRTSFEPKHFFPLSWLKLQDLPDGDGLLHHSWLITYQRDNEQNIFEFGATWMQEKQLWLKTLGEYIDKANARDNSDDNHYFAVSSLSPVTTKGARSFNSLMESSHTVKRSRSNSSISHSVDSTANSPDEKLSHRRSGYFDITSSSKFHDADHTKSFMQQNQSMPSIMPLSSTSTMSSHHRSYSLEKFASTQTAGKVCIKHSTTINRRSSIDVRLSDVSTLDTLHSRAKFQREQEVIQQQQQHTNELNRRRSRISFHGDMIDFEKHSSPQPRESNSLPSTPVKETFNHRASWAPGWSPMRRQRAGSLTKKSDDSQEENALDNGDGSNSQENDKQESKSRMDFMRSRKRDTWAPHNHSPLADDNTMILAHQDTKVPQPLPLPTPNRSILLSPPMSPLFVLQERNKILLSKMVSRLANTIGVNAASRPKRIGGMTIVDEEQDDSSTDKPIATPQKPTKGSSLLRRVASQYSQRPSPLRFLSNMNNSTNASDSELPSLIRTVSAPESPSSPGRPVSFTVKTPTEQQPLPKSTSASPIDQNLSKPKIFRNLFNKINKSSTITPVVDVHAKPTPENNVAETSGAHVPSQNWSPAWGLEGPRSASSVRSRMSISSNGTEIATNYGPLDEQDDFMPLTFRKFLQGESLFRSLSGVMVDAPTTDRATLESDSESDEDIDPPSDVESKRKNLVGMDSSLNSSSSIDLSHSDPSTLRYEAVPCHTRDDDSGTKEEWDPIVPRRSSTSNSRSSEESEHTLKASEREIGFRRA